MKIKLRDFFYVKGYFPYAVLEEDARESEGEIRIWLLSGSPGSLVFHEHVIKESTKGAVVIGVENYFTTFLTPEGVWEVPCENLKYQGISIDGERITIRILKEDYDRILEEYDGDLSRLLEKADEIREIEGKNGVIVELTYYIERSRDLGHLLLFLLLRPFPVNFRVQFPYVNCL